VAQTKIWEWAWAGGSVKVNLVAARHCLLLANLFGALWSLAFSWPDKKPTFLQDTLSWLLGIVPVEPRLRQCLVARSEESAEVDILMRRQFHVERCPDATLGGIADSGS
jgi:hypothetical protein